jgi:CDP-diacylglycerol--glycerol-3-phosphate 3-phosphatidyltransferase
MVDGTVARKTNSTSQFGSQLDTIADLIFVVAAMIKLLPVIHLLGWLWIWGGVIAIMKLASIIWGFVRIKKLVAYHSVFNKITGLQCFLLPFTLQFIEPTYSFAVVCIIATIAAVQEACYTMS